MSAELTIIVQNDRTVRARTQGSAEETGEVRFDKLQAETIGIFEDWLSQGKISRRQELEVLGKHLYRIIFDDTKVSPYFEKTLSDARSSGDRLRLQLSFQEGAADLASLPWEYLCYPETENRPGFFLSTHVDLVLLRYIPLSVGRSDRAELTESPLRILIVVANPEDLGPVIPKPVIDIFEELDRQHVLQIDILDRPTPHNFLNKLRETKPHVLHLIGHGQFNKPDKLGQIALLQSDETYSQWIPDKVFAEYFTQTQVFPRLVFLHLCEGATINFNANFARLAPQLILANIQAVVAMQYPIPNNAAIAFSRAFYSQLMREQPIDHAVQYGRWYITADDPKAYDNRVFGTPVLYMHSHEGVIFKVPKRTGSIEGERHQVRGRNVGEPQLGRQTEQPKPSVDRPLDVKGLATSEVGGFVIARTIISAGQKKMQEMTLGSDQTVKMYEMFLRIPDELFGKTSDEMKKIIYRYWDDEQDPELKVVIWAMVEAAGRLEP